MTALYIVASTTSVRTVNIDIMNIILGREKSPS